MRFETHFVSPQATTHFHERQLSFGEHPKAGLFAVAEVARVGTFWVPVTPMNVAPVEWSMTCTDQYVRVPVFAYRTIDHDPAKVVGMAFQLACQAMLSLADCLDLRSLDVCHLYLGKVIHDQGDHFTYYLGLSMELS